MNTAIIIAGGSGARMGQDIPKQFINVYDKPVLIYTLEGFQKASSNRCYRGCLVSTDGMMFSGHTLNSLISQSSNGCFRRKHRAGVNPKWCV